MSSQTEYIDRFIRFYANETIQSRGKQLYKNDVIKSVEYDEKFDTYTFRVKGTNTYTTKISSLKNHNLSTSCSCPYNYGVICKHTVAVLLFLKDSNLEKIPKTKPKKNKTQKKQIVYRQKNEPVLIKEYRNITPELIEKHTTSTVFLSSKIYSEYDIESASVSEKKIVFKLIKDKYYSYRRTTVTVTFKKDKNGVLSSTTESTNCKPDKLKHTEALCLQHLVKTNSANIFDKIFNNLNNLKEKSTKKFGLKPKDFNTYFQIIYDLETGLKLQRKPKAYGLLAIENTLSNYKPIFDVLTESNIVVLNENKKTKFKKIGFTFSLSSYDGYTYDVFSAKPNKAGTKLISTFEEFNEHESHIFISEKQKKIIESIQKFNFLKELDEKYFSLSKKIFLALTNEPFVFFKANNYRFYKKDLHAISLSSTLVKIVLNVVKTDLFIEAKVRLQIGDTIIDFDQINEEESSALIFSYKDTLYHLNNYKDVVLYQNFKDGLKIVKDQEEVFFNNVIKPLSSDFEINFDEDTFNHKKIKLDYQTEQIYLSEKDDHIVIQPQVVYDNGTSVLLTSKGNYIYKDDKTNTIIEYERNKELENSFIDEIAALHPDFEDQKTEKYFYLSYDDFTKDFWFYDFFDVLSAHNIEIFGLKELKNFKYSPFKGKVNTSISSGEDWFDVSVEVSFGNNTVSLSDIKKAIINQKKYIQLKDGSVGIMPEEWVHKLEKYFRNGEIKDDKLAISKLKYDIIDELFDNIDESEVLEEIAEKRKKIATFKEISKTKVPKAINATLRDYQKEGLNWLNFLDDMGWGGILADDMGLGKTLQILTFIQHIIRKNKTPNLIVLPTSLLFNWKAEIEKFAPKIKAYFYYGADRKKSTVGFKKHHIIFTTYGTLLRDIEILNQFQFNYIILDESQAIKNPASRRYKAVNLIKAKNRVALTGTPIENSTFDLFAQMNFVNPGIFGSVNNFKLNYSNPIDKDGNEMIANELQRIINPFILRRTKEKVAKELPAKTEDILYCEMETEQRKIYDAYRNDYRNKLLKNVEQKGLGKSKLMVLKALTRLRQICDSPSLIKDVVYKNKAIKIQEIVNHITQKTAQHKILLFSQFVGMLSLIKEELDKLNIKYEYLDGKSNSKKREESVNNFQNNKELRVFLISLKAGGTGLNLTAADYVFIVDPWWNPAVENQAIDRCYRIGQDKTVFAYRMICKNTIEEKIINLQAKKKKLATDIIHTDENMMKNLSVNDIKDLFG